MCNRETSLLYTYLVRPYVIYEWLFQKSMWVADEKLINELGSYGYNKQSSRSGLGQSNFMQTKHVHEHFDLLISSILQ